MRYRCNDAAASGAAASLSRGRSVSEIKPDPKPARVRIVVCAVSKHRTAAQEPRARRPDPHPIRSAPEGSTRHCLFAVSRVASEFPTQPVVERGRFAYISIPYHTIFRVRWTRPTKSHVRFRLPRARLARAANATAARAHAARRLSIIVCRGRSVGRPARGRGPAGTSRAARGRLFGAGAALRIAGGATGVRGRNDHRPLTSAQPVPEARSRHRPSRIGHRGIAIAGLLIRHRRIPLSEHQKWTRALHSSGVLRYLFSMGMRL